MGIMGRRWRWVVLAVAYLALSACRLGFDALPGDGSTPIDDSDLDADPVARTITLGDRAASNFKNVVRDTMLVEGAPAQSFGGTALLSVYAPVPSRFIALYAFDLSGIPASTRAAAARLQLHVEDTGDTVTGRIELYRLSEAWVEGVLDGGGADGATWNERAPGQAWSMAGGSRGELAGSLMDAGMPGPLTLTISAAIVQGWIDAPATNHGVLVYAPPGGTHVHPHASESGAVESRPQLELDVF